MTLDDMPDDLPCLTVDDIGTYRVLIRRGPQVFSVWESSNIHAQMPFTPNRYRLAYAVTIKEAEMMEDSR